MLYKNYHVVPVRILSKSDNSVSLIASYLERYVLLFDLVVVGALLCFALIKL